MKPSASSLFAGFGGAEDTTRSNVYSDVASSTGGSLLDFRREAAGMHKDYRTGLLEFLSNLEDRQDGFPRVTDVGGCTDTGANNYSSGADYDDGSCTYGDVVVGEVTYIKEGSPGWCAQQHASGGDTWCCDGDDYVCTTVGD